MSATAAVASADLDAPSVPVRRTPRQRVLYAGILADPATRRSWRVTIREVSTHGAQVFLDPHLRVTDHPVLIIPRHGLAAITRKAWQHGGRAGFEFQGGISLSRPVSGEREWLRNLWLAAEEGPG